jgi:small subunit ribosomal protein S2
VVDVKHENIAVTEAKKLGIPVFSLSSTDCDMGMSLHPVLANDTITTSVEFIVKRVRDAFKAGKTS